MQIDASINKDTLFLFLFVPIPLCPSHAVCASLVQLFSVTTTLPDETDQHRISHLQSEPLIWVSGKE